MEKRLRPVTYAEALAAKKTAEDLDIKMEEVEEIKVEPIRFTQTSISKIDQEDLPSGGGSYPKNSEIYYTPLTFGETKFLSGSTLSDPTSIEFFLGKIQTSFPKKDLTYYDFYYLTIMIKLSTFGEIEYNMNFECDACGEFNNSPFTANDLLFEEIRVDLPITIDLRHPMEVVNEKDEVVNVIKRVSFNPITIGNFLEMLTLNEVGDDDKYLSRCIIGNDIETNKKLIKEHLVGPDTQILEMLDVYLFHGVQDLHFKCKNMVSSGDGTEEVCGHVHDIPFQYITEHVGPTDRCKHSLGKRVHFGIQNGD